MFEDRVDAGRQLARVLRTRPAAHPIVVIAVSCGGVPVGAEVARELDAELEVLVVERLWSPGPQRRAVAVLAEGAPPILQTDELAWVASGLPREALQALMHIGFGVLDRRRSLLGNGRETATLAGRTALLVDDGMASGTTLHAAIASLRQRQPAEVVVALPVAPWVEAAHLRTLADDVVVIEAPPLFGRIADFYRNYAPVGDEEAARLLVRDSWRRAASG